MSIDISFSISDPLLVAGVERARDLYNAALPEEATPLTSEQYAAWIGRQAVKSWAREHQRALWEAGAITLIERDASLSAIDAL